MGAELSTIHQDQYHEVLAPAISPEPFDFADDEDVNQLFVDPVTSDIMAHPMFVVESGKTYDLHTLARRGRDQTVDDDTPLMDPVTGKPVKAVLNREMKTNIEVFLSSKYDHIVADGTLEQKAQLAGLVCDDRDSSAANSATNRLLQNFTQQFADSDIVDAVCTLPDESRRCMARFVTLRGDTALQRLVLRTEKLAKALWCMNDASPPQTRKLEQSLYSLFGKSLDTDSSQLSDCFQDIQACQELFKVDLIAMMPDWRNAARLLFAFKDDQSLQLDKLKSPKPLKSLARLRTELEHDDYETVKAMLMDKHLCRWLPNNDEEVVYNMFARCAGHHDAQVIGRLQDEPIGINFVNLIAMHHGPEAALSCTRELFKKGALTAQPGLYQTIDFEFGHGLNTTVAQQASSAELALLFMEQAWQQAQLKELRCLIAKQ